MTFARRSVLALMNQFDYALIGWSLWVWSPRQHRYILLVFSPLCRLPRLRTAGDLTGAAFSPADYRGAAESE